MAGKTESKSNSPGGAASASLGREPNGMVGMKTSPGGPIDGGNCGQYLHQPHLSYCFQHKISTSNDNGPIARRALSYHRWYVRTNNGELTRHGLIAVAPPGLLCWLRIILGLAPCHLYVSRHVSSFCPKAVQAIAKSVMRRMPTQIA